MKKGFTLVELVIVIVIVGILSIIAVPIYRGYVQKAKTTEGQALVGAIVQAQKIYHAVNGVWHNITSDVSYDETLGIDARGNKYFKAFYSYSVAATDVLPGVTWAVGEDYLIGIKLSVSQPGTFSWQTYDRATGIYTDY